MLGCMQLHVEYMGCAKAELMLAYKFVDAQSRQDGRKKWLRAGRLPDGGDII